jgi:CO dehydrogenase maturation factor
MPILCCVGKGGTGKTVFTALMLRLLIEAGRKNILVIDADPATNLPDALGVHVPKTVGEVVNEEFKGSVSEIPSTMDKRAFLESLIFKTLLERDDFDLLAMGRVEGEGCYCLINDLITDIVDSLSKNYDYILMDMEAGLEHISRRTARDADIMIILTDPSKMGLQTAKRIYELAKKVHIKFKRVYLVGNMFPDEEESMKLLEGLDIEIAGIVPLDQNVVSFNLWGKPLIELPAGSPALEATKDVLGKIGLL